MSDLDQIPLFGDDPRALVAVNLRTGRAPVPAAADVDVDLFAGPGGWDQGVRALGVTPLGIEWKGDACATAEAAGHRRLQADIALLNPRAVLDAHYGPGRSLRGLIASPPCQGFSAAGKGRGRDDAALLLDAVPAMLDRDVRPELHDAMTDSRSVLVLEPLRWALELRPEWCAWEQVPAVLPIWEACAAVLRSLGYTVATGVLNAEQHGVPQTRQRAILVARSPRLTDLLGPAALPAPTHSRYYTRTPAKLDADVAKWVSMADALGWNPGDLVGFPRRADTADALVLDGVAYRRRDLHPADRPAPALTEKVRSWERFLRMGDPGGASVREVDQPAPTVAFGHRAAGVTWEAERPPAREELEAAGLGAHPSLDGSTRRPVSPGDELPLEGGPWIRMGTNVGSAVRAVTDPAPTVHYGERLNTVTWEAERPPTREDLEAAGLGAPPSGPSPLRRRVTVAEAAVLQTFPADYPWHGTASGRYRQVGDAVPPLLAQVVVAAVSGLALAADEDAAAA